MVTIVMSGLDTLRNSDLDFTVSLARVYWDQMVVCPSVMGLV